MTRCINLGVNVPIARQQTPNKFIRFSHPCHCERSVAIQQIDVARSALKIRCLIPHVTYNKIKLPRCRRAFLFWQSRAGLGYRRPCKICRANRRAPARLFAAGRTPTTVFDSPCDIQQNKNRRTSRRFLFWQSQGESNPCSQNENLMS